MKKKHYVKAMGLAVVAATFFAVVACDNEILSGPDYNSGNGGKSSEVVRSSSSDIPLSSRCNAFLPECGYTVEQLCKMGETRFCGVSSSSSAIPLSSMCDAFLPECGYTVEQLCEMGETQFCGVSSSSSAIPLSSMCNAFLPECGYTAEQLCKMGQTWFCENSSSSKGIETCRHISDYDGMTAQGNCVNQNGRTAVDCMTGVNYECKNNNWQPVICLNIKPNECEPGMGGCGYRLCQPDGIQEIADCENGVIYVCNGESWEVKKTEENQHCARGELEYCDACYKEGAFEGHYKCEGGKWKTYGMGDDICVHITDVKCEFGDESCGSCDVNGPKRVTDCVTGNEYRCEKGFWSIDLRDCEAGNVEGCGRKDVLPPCEANEGGSCGPNNNAWLNEPCKEGEASRDLRIKMSDGSYRSENYICVNNRWVERFKYYECGEKEDCDRPSFRCQESSAIGTACSKEGESSEIDGCVFLCSAGRYRYAPVTW